MNTTQTLKTHTIGTGHYVLMAAPFKSPALDGRFEIEHFVGYGLNEWRLFERVSGYRGEWCNTFATKREAIDAANETGSAGS